MFASSKCVRGIIAVLATGLGAGIVARAEEQKPAAPTKSVVYTTTQAVPDGKELFQREWIPNDPRSHGGDGLGPVFNDSSCVACHNLGGPGGGGAASKNVDIITAFSNQAAPQPQDVLEPIVGTLPSAIASIVGAVTSTQPKPAAKKTDDKVDAAQQKKDFAARQKKELTAIHPGFATARSVVLHHFSTNEKYDAWRAQILGVGNFFEGNFNLTVNGDVQPADVTTAIPVADVAVQPAAVPQPAPALEVPADAAVAESSPAAAARIRPALRQFLFKSSATSKWLAIPSPTRRCSNSKRRLGWLKPRVCKVIPAISRLCIPAATPQHCSAPV